MKHIQRGFTLLELLIVIAIMGVMAVIVFVAINPAEKQAQSRDTGRLSSVTQIGRALQGFYTNKGSYPGTSNWAQDLVDNGELSTFPSGIAYNVVNACVSFPQPGTNPTYCYALDADNGALVFTRLEAQSHADKCPGATDNPYFVFSTADARGGTVCNEGDPAPWAAGTRTYVD